MTVSENNSPKVQYIGPYAIGAYLPLTFPYDTKTDVKCKIGDATVTYGTDYEIVDTPTAQDPLTYPNSLHLKVAVSSGVKVTIYRETPLDQQTTYPQNSKFRSEHVESDFDKVCMEQQEQNEKLARCIIAPITIGTFDGQLPDPSAGKAIKWNSTGTGLANSTYDVDEQVTLATTQAAIATTKATAASNSAAAAAASAASAASTASGFDTHAAEKQTAFDTNAAEKQTAVDASATSAAASATSATSSSQLSSLWAQGPESDLQTRTADPTAHSSKYYAEQGRPDNVMMQYDTMPTATSDLVGKPVEYRGTTTPEYTHGYVYEVVLSSGNYIWQQVNVQPQGSSSLATLTDVTLTTPSNDQVLKYNSTTGSWENGTAQSPASLATLTDVTLTTLSDEQILKYSSTSSKWVNVDLVETQVIIKTYTNGTSGYRIWSDGYCEQWGVTGTSTNTITLLLSFADTNYNIQFSQQTNTQYQSIKSKTVNGFVLQGSTSYQNWVCRGYLAEGEY